LWTSSARRSADCKLKELPARLALSSAAAATVSATSATGAAIEASTATATTAAPASTAAESALRFRARLVHHERTAFQLVLVELADRLLRIVVGRHLDEGEPACPACRHVPHHTNAFDLPRPAEKFRELVLRR
jgi:hypothetical protein